MPIKKPSILLASTTPLHAFYNTPPPSSTSSTHPHPTHTRSYASRAPHHGNYGSSYPWPDSPHPHKPPTPYQILELKKGAPYSKRRFFELVKIYHPDRATPPTHIQSDAGCPHAVRLERYRLIVAAHGILSDPAKRSAYDRWGAGWGSAQDITAPSSHERRRRSQWAPGQDPTANATWEDWERWYRQRDRPEESEKQHPIFVSNGAFVGCILLFAAVGGYGQVTRAGSFGATLVEQRDIVHSKTSRELRRARQASKASSDREERIQSFLRHRDAATHSEEAYRRLLPNQEVCSSEEVVKGAGVGAKQSERRGAAVGGQ